jgi:Rrf2 family protein
MRVTTWTEYSLIIALHLAQRRLEGAGPIAARELAESERLPADYVEQILLRLRRGEVVTSVRGAKGGYLLARDPSEITVYDVMTAADRHTFEINCENRPVESHRCAPNADCSIRPVWLALRDRIDGFLRAVSVADLMLDEAAVAQLVQLEHARPDPDST